MLKPDFVITCLGLFLIIVVALIIGNPSEITTKFDVDPSWEAEIDAFTNSILTDSPIESGSSSEALKTMQLVYKIYFADEAWCEKFEIRDPDRGL